MDKLLDNLGVNGTAALFTASVGAIGFLIGMQRANQDSRMIQNTTSANLENNQCNNRNRR